MIFRCGRCNREVDSNLEEANNLDDLDVCPECFDNEVMEAKLE